MSGHSPDAQQLRDILWRDSTLESISADYDSVSIRILESTGRTRTITCGGYIGYRAIGIWDEMLVLDGVVLREDGFLKDCVFAVESRIAIPVSVLSYEELCDAIRENALPLPKGLHFSVREKHWRNVARANLATHEYEVVGRWESFGDGVRGDAACERIEHLVAHAPSVRVVAAISRQRS